MIGDSITWAENGDYWRKHLIGELPRLAFKGTHSGCLGYSHEGEGGNTTSLVLERIHRIPECPYYHLHIGTNDNNILGDLRQEQIDAQAGEVAARIIRIVEMLLDKNGTMKVFLGTIMPCFTDNPNRDIINSRVNDFLRLEAEKDYLKSKVVLIDYEKYLRTIPDWEPLILLHPTIPGYETIAKITADAIVREFKIVDKSTVPVLHKNAGVKIENLWDETSQQTCRKVIAGWYTVSFRVIKGAGQNVKIRISGKDRNVKFYFDQTSEAIEYNGRLYVNFFTGYENYEYNMNVLKIRCLSGDIDQILFEKTRPSAFPSSYGKTEFIDESGSFSYGEELA
jgi:hypothetical protein